MEANETPQALQNDLLVAHVGDGVDQANAIEGELDKVALARRALQIVTHQVTSVLNLLLARLQDQRICSLDVVVDDIVWKDSALALRKEEKWKFIDLTLAEVVLGVVWVMDVKDASSEP